MSRVSLNCLSCFMMTQKAEKPTDLTCHTEIHYQQIFTYFSFVVQQPSNSGRVQQYDSLNGETCYCLMSDHYTQVMHGCTLRPWVPIIDCLNELLLKFSSDSLGKDVRFFMMEAIWVTAQKSATSSPRKDI